MSVHKNSKGGFYFCRMRDSCTSHVKIDVPTLEDIVLHLIKKLIAVLEKDRENDCQDKKMNELALEKLKEEKRQVNRKEERNKTSRLLFYCQWKEGKIAEGEYRERRDEAAEQEERCKKRRNELEERIKQLIELQKEDESDDFLQKYGGLDALTKEIVEELVRQIDVYGEDRVEIRWKFWDGVWGDEKKKYL